MHLCLIFKKTLERSVLTRDSPFLKKLYKRECREERFIKNKHSLQSAFAGSSGELGGAAPGLLIWGVGFVATAASPAGTELLALSGEAAKSEALSAALWVALVGQQSDGLSVFSSIYGCSVIPTLPSQVRYHHGYHAQQMSIHIVELFLSFFF